MDGSHRDIFVTSKTVLWPNGLSLDIPAGRLYWVDAFYDRIETILLNGTDRKVGRRACVVFMVCVARSLLCVDEALCDCVGICVWLGLWAFCVLTCVPMDVYICVLVCLACCVVLCCWRIASVKVHLTGPVVWGRDHIRRRCPLCCSSCPGPPHLAQAHLRLSPRFPCLFHFLVPTMG